MKSVRLILFEILAIKDFYHIWSCRKKSTRYSVGQIIKVVALNPRHVMFEYDVSVTYTFWNNRKQSFYQIWSCRKKLKRWRHQKGFWFELLIQAISLKSFRAISIAGSKQLRFNRKPYYKLKWYHQCKNYDMSKINETAEVVTSEQKPWVPVISDFRLKSVVSRQYCIFSHLGNDVCQPLLMLNINPKYQTNLMIDYWDMASNVCLTFWPHLAAILDFFKILNIRASPPIIALMISIHNIWLLCTVWPRRCDTQCHVSKNGDFQQKVP